MPQRTETRIEANESEITVGIDAANFSAAISSSGNLTLGIGVAEVQINLKNPNDSSIDLAWGLYSIEGSQEGCTVILNYYIAGQLVRTETRIIPECDSDEPEPEPEPEPDPGSEPKPPKVPSSYRQYKALVYGKGYEFADHIYYGEERNFRIINPEFDSVTDFYTFEVDAVGSTWIYDQFNGIVFGEKEESPSNTAFWEYDDRRTFRSVDYIRRFFYFYHGIAIVGIKGTGQQINSICEEVFSGWKNSYTNPYDYHYFTGYYNLELNQWIITGEFRPGASERTINRRDYFIEAIELSKYPNIEKLPPPYKEPSNMPCDCEHIEELLEEIYEALNVQELLSKGFVIPNRMIVPNGKETTKLDNYLSILEYQMRQVDHVGIHPFIATIKDGNEAVAGDQSLSIQFPNATAALKYIAELGMENKGDAATRLSLLVRLSYASAQITTILVQTARSIKALSSFFGMPPVERIEKVKLPFDILLGIKPGGKGFGKKEGKTGEQIKAELLKKIDQNSEDATEDMLPDFMKVGELEVKTQDFRPSTEFDFWASLKRTLRID